ncbi:MAG: recombination protein RecR [Gammaproteobacteria bacterium]|nr:MAG: recombination protein RecR [Gammaproteobacteria bacterium]
MKFSLALGELVEALQILPGVGPKSAQRIALNLLERNRDQGLYLASKIESAMTRVTHCSQCRNYTEETLCVICASKTRNESLLCVVETPSDVMAIEQTGSFTGLYFVLMGHLSPLDGVGPEQLGISQLKETVEQRSVSEIILATNPTVEGEATAHYIAEQLSSQDGLKLTRIAYGVAMGGELEYTDDNTLARALEGRRAL